MFFTQGHSTFDCNDWKAITPTTEVDLMCCVKINAITEHFYRYVLVFLRYVQKIVHMASVFRNILINKLLGTGMLFLKFYFLGKANGLIDC